jgi:hypothetical protein
MSEPLVVHLGDGTYEQFRHSAEILKNPKIEHTRDFLRRVILAM